MNPTQVPTSGNQPQPDEVQPPVQPLAAPTTIVGGGDPVTPQVTDPTPPPSKLRQFTKLAVFAVGILLFAGVVWVSYESFIVRDHTITLGGKSMKVASMTSGACKGRMQVMGMTYMGGPLCLDSMSQSKSMAAMEMANSRPNKGMIYDGLSVASTNGPCAGEFVVNNLNINGHSVCTHGPDPTPDNLPSVAGLTPIPADQNITNPDVAPGSTSIPTTLSSPSTIDNSASSSMEGAKTASAQITNRPKVVLTTKTMSTKPLNNIKLTAGPAVLAPLYTCPQPGSDGFRVQALYVHFANTPDRSAALAGPLATNIRQTDENFASAAQLTNGTAHLRWLTDTSCNVIINDVTVPAPPASDSGNWVNLWYDVINGLKAQGYAQSNHKYLVFDDTNLPSICGAGAILSGENFLPTGQNPNDNLSGYAEVGADCWQTDVDTSVATHELIHALGAVNPAAPYGTAGQHCVDSSEVMCYNDGPGVTQQQLCPSDVWDSNDLDCQQTSYFSAHPAAGSYLATHWNIYNSGYLAHEDGGIIAPKPTAVTFSLNGSQDTFIFKRGVDYSTQYWDQNNQAAGWQSLGGVSTSDPVAVTYAPNQLFVFIRGSGGVIYAKHFNGSTWGAWTNIAPFAASNVSAISPAPNKVYIYYRALGTGNLIIRGWNPTVSWLPLTNLGGSLDSDPVAITTSATDMEVYAIAGSSSVPYRIVWNGAGWSGWQSLGGRALSNPSVVALSSGERDVFVRATNNHLFVKAFKNNAWGSWIDLGGIIFSSPAAVGSDSGTMTVYARASKNVVYKRSFNGSSWAGWQPLPGVSALSSGEVSTVVTNGVTQVVWHNTAHLTFIYQETATPQSGVLATDSAWSHTPFGAPNYSL